MVNPYLGMMQMIAFNFPPVHWAACNGALIPVNDNPALFSLLGDTFGGDARTNFGLPDMRGRAPVYQGKYGIVQQGQKSGFEEVTLTNAQTGHNHDFQVDSLEGDSFLPFSNANPTARYTISTANTQFPTGVKKFYAQNSGGLDTLSSQSIGSVGSNAPHTNIQPTTVIGFVIALNGAYPPRN
ncbi:phage tail protein [Pseudoalteromonas luteoviolacea]|uniref:phage tail protein n=1 Tax=Pseudoalteromonas luteoviolacea TaxID=43657 RepID=UPI001B384C48|nr:tail fiber protein [Pseudoalteromonas luteoviolacea]MBQ4811368.1 phage tail protein [Pseudoalteromonas luteoviolacea]